MKVVAGNELYYDAHVPDESIQQLTNQLVTFDFFGPEYGNVARLQLVENVYRITLVVDESLWVDSEVMDDLTRLKWLLEVEFGEGVQIELESFSLTGNSRIRTL